MSLQEEFFAAVFENDIQKVVQVLLSSPLDINMQDSVGRTAILLAALHCRPCIAKTLMVFGANPNIEDKYGETAISMATANNSGEILDILRDTKKEDIKYPEQGMNMQEMFFHTVFSKKIGATTAILAGASTIKIDDKDKCGNTAIHLAVSNNDLYMLEILAAFGANLNIQNDQGNTALSTAILESNSKTIQILLKLGAKRNIPNIRSNFPIHLAVERKHLTIIKELCTEDVVNQKNFNGLAPIHLAVKHSSENVVKALLLCNHTDINIRDNNGDTPLITAGKNNFVEIARLLLAHEADFNLKNHAGQMFSDFMECLAITTHLYKEVICQSSPLKRKKPTDEMNDESDKNSHKPKVESLEYTYQKPLCEQNTARRFATCKRKNLTNTLNKCENFFNVSDINLPRSSSQRRLGADSPRSINMSSPRSISSKFPYECENSYDISDISLGGSSFRSNSLDMFDISTSESSVSRSSCMSRLNRYFSTLDLDSSEYGFPKSPTTPNAKRARLR